MIAYGSLKKAIELIQEYGQERIYNEINEISQKAKTAFAARNLLEQSVVARDHHSSIFNLKGDDDLFHLLQEHHIHCAQRGAGIRVGFSYFNTDQDLEKLLNVIDLIPHDGL
jgi:selenocysteine lyase/cysteine desulfurase